MDDGQRKTDFFVGMYRIRPVKKKVIPEIRNHLIYLKR